MRSDHGRAALILAVVAAAWAGCAAQVACPEGRRPESQGCICADGTIEVDGACVAAPSSPEQDAGGGAGGFRSAARPDAATANVDVDVDVAPDGGASRDGRGDGGADASQPDQPEAFGHDPSPQTRDPNCPRSCPTGRCNAAGVCLTGPPECGDGHRDANEECDDNNHFNYDDCVGCQLYKCGDGHVNREREECDLPNSSADPVVAEQLGGWAPADCSRATQCQRIIYTLCETERDCGGQGGMFCAAGYCAPVTCVPGVTNCTLAPCPRIPGFSTFPQLSNPSICLVGCAADRKCPLGMQCRSDGLCVGKSWTPEKGGFPVLEEGGQNASFERTD